MGLIFELRDGELVMDKKETKGVILIVLGIIIMSISVLDIISIASSVLNIIF